MEKMTNFVYNYSFVGLGAMLVIIGTLFMYKKYDENENSGIYLGAFWLFTGFLLLMIYFKIVN